MASKDLGVYREATGGTSVTTTEATVSLDTTDHEDAAFSRSGNLVTVNEDCRVLAFWEGGFTHTGTTGSRSVRVELEIDAGGVGSWSRAEGGVAWNGLSDVDGCDACTVSGVAVLDCSSGDELRLRYATEVSGNVTEDADGIALQLLRLPSSFDVCVLTENGGRTMGSGFENETWDTEVVRDSGSFTLSGTNGIQVAATDQYLIISSNHITCESNLGAAGSGILAKTRIQVNATTTPIGGQSRKVCLAGAPDLSAASTFICQPMSLTANDVVRIQNRWQNNATASDVKKVLGGKRGIFAMVRIGSSANAVHLSRSADAIETPDVGDPADTPFAVEWDVEDLKDTGFTHSTVTNPSRLTFPTGKVLSGLKLGIAGDGSRGANDLHIRARTQLNGTTDLEQGVGSTGPNVGDAGTTHHHHTDIGCGRIDVHSSSDYEEIIVDNLGTAADTNVVLAGGVAGVDSFWWGIHVDDWPLDTVQAPAASETLTALPPTVLEEVTLSAPAASSTITAVTATVVLGALTVTAPVASEALTAVAPTVDLGALTVAAPAASESLAGVAPSVAFGGLTVQPGAASETLTALAGTANLGGTSLQAPAASLSVNALAPSVAMELSVAVPAASEAVTALAPSVVLGVSISAPAASESLTAVAPGVDLGSLTVSAPSASTTETGLEPTFVPGGISVTAPAAPLAVAALAPSVDLGALAVSAPAANYTETALAASVAFGAVSLLAPSASVTLTAVAPTTRQRLAGLYSEIGRLCRNRWRLEIAEPLSVATRYENMPFTAPDGTYTELAVVHDGTTQLHVGNEETAVMATGYLEARVWGGLHRGVHSLYVGIEAIRAAFTDKVHGDRLIFGSPTESGQGRSGARYWVEMRCPFKIDDTLGRAPVRVLGTLRDGGYEEAYDIIRQRANAALQAMDTPTPLQLPNMPGEPPNESRYARLTHLPVESFDLARGTSLKEIGGIAVFQVFGPLGRGEAGPLEVVDTIDEAFRSVLDRGVNFDPPQPGRGMRSGSRWIRNVSVRWRAQASS